MTTTNSTGPDTGAGTEYGAKRDRLARALLNIGTGLDWGDADRGLQIDYAADADEIIHSHPHLLSLAERDRLTGQFPHLSV